MAKQICPISEKKFDEKKTRIIALLVVVSTFLFLLTHQLWIIVILNLDFFLRGFISSKDSYLQETVDFLFKKLQLKPGKQVEQEPKKFAAKLGFIITLSIILTGAFGILNSNLVLSTTLIAFSTLESFTKICIGCYVYSFLKQIFPNNF